ncbi:CD109 antigen-like isoform X1 [Anopheles funestus]|uniref:CD109 antigen-like isoform X1 n=1 Tax=Anopheles funestus TaxID=62324 RepID=UPI0020C6D4FB|nr:CD109 antigen-like isoform X1 [Anopheles funestus]
MWQFIRVRILTVILFAAAAHGILVVGPKFIRANQNYTVMISNFNTNLNKVNLMLRIEGHTRDGQNVLNITKSVDVRKQMNRVINCNMPKDLSTGYYKITIDGHRGFSFHKEVDLVYLSKTVSGLIQIDKPVFKPGDTVQFRVIVLDTELKPSTRIKTVQVMIRDPQNNVVRQWSSARLYAGVFENNLQIAPTPMLGIWNISVLVDGEVLVSKTFEVKEYVLSSFDVEVVPTVIPLEEHQSLSLTIAAHYHFGKPVKGHVKVELYLEDDKRDQVKEFEMSGMGQVTFRFNEELELFHDQQDVTVKTTFNEQFTGRTAMKEQKISVYRHLYRATMEKDSALFCAGIIFKCKLKLTYHDGLPVKNVPMLVIVEGEDVDNEKVYVTDSKGAIKLEMRPTEATQEMTIRLEDNTSQFSFHEVIKKAATDTFIKLNLVSSVKINQPIRMLVTCNTKMTFYYYYVVSKGTILYGNIKRVSGLTKDYLTIDATEGMLPKATILVATITNAMMVTDTFEVDLNQLSNKLEIRMENTAVKPGHEIELQLYGRPNAHVWLAAYDKGLLQFNNKHDLFWKDVIEAFDNFHAVKEDEYDVFHSIGLFAKMSGEARIETTNTASMRFGGNYMKPTSTMVPYRTNFQESWLWQNVTIGTSGKRNMIEMVPDSTTSWYLTGFSIDPVYGLGIIKKPIQFTTIQPFYIVDSLPYSIKRGEVIALQFTLFNNLEREYTADVTLYSVANQTEFIGQPVEDISYTKSVSVPPRVGVPISFLAKARKLGEMAVRVKTTIKARIGQESDALEKVIRVMPESLVQNKMESRFFAFNTHTSQTFPINLDLDKKAEHGSKKLRFRLNPSLLTTVINNLGNLLDIPSGSGEQNMIHFVPNIVVLDYLHAIGSKEQNLIDKATSLLRQGYQNQMRYRQTDGSFGVWQNKGGSVFLTAFVAKSMQTASKYITEVDVAMVEKTYDWLASKQHSSGRFDEVGAVIHQEMQGGLRNGIALTSYVLTALLENEKAKEKHAAVIQKAMSYLSSNLEDIQNPYDLSIATYTLMLYGHEKKTTTLDKLIGLSTPRNDGNDLERYWNSTNSIETTAYALLSFVLAGKYEDGIPVMRWLVNQRYVTGSFPRTQDTFVGLKALTKLAEKISPLRNDYTIQLNFKHRMSTKLPTKHFRISSPDINITDFEDIPQETKSLEITVGGIGFGLLQVIYQYSLNLVDFAHRFHLTVTKLSSDYELRLKVCTSFIPELTDQRSNLAHIEVAFPSGYVVDQNPISEQTSFNPIQHTDIRYGGTSVVVYYNNMGTERNCFTVTAYRRFRVALKRPAYVVVYDSVNENWNAIKLYEVDKQEVCDICDETDCSKYCKKR